MTNNKTLPEEKQLPEAPLSVNTKVKSPNGFEYQLTLRAGVTDEDFSQLMTLIAEKEHILLKKNWTPLTLNTQKGGFPKKEPEYVPDRICPTDGARLVYATKKDGTKYVKCENNKWDKLQNRATGCPFVEWPKTGGAY